MGLHQRVDLRVNFGGGMQFSTEEGKRAYEDSCYSAREKQTVQYAIAPKRQLTLPRGDRVLKAGDAITIDDLRGNPDRSPWVLMRDYVACGIVLERDDLPEPPAAA